LTSVLIGIVSSGIEERLSMLRKGNSIVLESGHIVILGFAPGEYALISQLIQADEKRPICLVVADSMERDEMEKLIQENISLPVNARIICRNVNICNPQSLSICSIPTCKTVVVNVANDDRTIKTLLAVSALLEKREKKDIQIVAAVSKDESMLPEYIREKSGIIMLQVYDVIARIIAHSCTQPGLSEAFTDLFNFEGAELYIKELPETAGKTFEEVICGMDGGVPLGICHNGAIMLNPDPMQQVGKGDALLLYADNFNAAHMTSPSQIALCSANSAGRAEPMRKVVVIGCNEVLDTILQELPENVREVVVADVQESDKELIEKYAKDRSNYDLSIFSDDISFGSGGLEKLVEEAGSVVLLSEHGVDDESADMHNIRLLLRLRDIRERLGHKFTITVEMRRESNRNLVAADDPTDFIVASDMASMVLAQLTETPELYSVFRELLSNEGNELYLKPAGMLGCAGENRWVAELRLTALSKGYILLGFLKNGPDRRAVELNPALRKHIELEAEDSLIVVGRQ